MNLGGTGFTFGETTSGSSIRQMKILQLPYKSTWGGVTKKIA
jgi:hypothetical protein